MKPCPFCGHTVDLENGDTVYPNGIGWQVRANGMTEYVSARQVPKQQWCYSMHCPSTAGGCGVEMSANTAQEAMDKWNRRT